MTESVAVGERPSNHASAGLQNLEFVARLGRPRAMLALLANLLRDDAALEEIASRSYHHVNHFDKIVLVETGHSSGYRLTLHIWDPPYSSEEISEELVHDHRFSFWSSIVTGSIRSLNFAPVTADVPGAARYGKYNYARGKAGPGERDFTENYEYVNDVWLARKTDSVHAAGQSYYLHHKEIHRVLLPTDSLACTVVLRGPRERACSNVYNATFPDQNVWRMNSTFTVDRFRSLLVRLIDRLAEMQT